MAIHTEHTGQFGPRIAARPESLIDPVPVERPLTVSAAQAVIGGMPPRTRLSGINIVYSDINGVVMVAFRAASGDSTADLYTILTPWLLESCRQFAGCRCCPYPVIVDRPHCFQTFRIVVLRGERLGENFIHELGLPSPRAKRDCTRKPLIPGARTYKLPLVDNGHPSTIHRPFIDRPSAILDHANQLACHLSPNNPEPDLSSLRSTHIRSSWGKILTSDLISGIRQNE